MLNCQQMVYEHLATYQFGYFQLSLLSVQDTHQLAFKKNSDSFESKSNDN